MSADLITVIFLVSSSFFMLIAAIGVIRFPDFYMRMSPSTSAATIGVICVMIAAIAHFGEIGVIGRAIAVITFNFLSSPIAAHMIGRAAYVSGVPLWHKTVKDELKGGYAKRVRQLHESGGPISAGGDAVPSAEAPSEIPGVKPAAGAGDGAPPRAPREKA